MGKTLEAKKIFIAATMQNDGKTTICLGLIKAFRKRFKRVGFIKPIGQRYVIQHGYKADEDSVLIEKLCGMKSRIQDMSPVAIEKGFTEKYITRGDSKRLIQYIEDSFSRVAENNQLVVIEGTGHAGVGSVFDLSNANVAKLLNAKVILITSGGIGKPIDEISLNMPLFEKEGVEVIGVIVNKVLKEKYEKVKKIVSLGLRHKNIDVLGVIPYEPLLAIPCIKHIVDEMDVKFMSKRIGLDNKVQKIVVGAMEPHEALKYIEKGTLIITPGDREDLLMTLLSTACLLERPQKEIAVSGIILTGGIAPNKRIMGLVKESSIPVLMSKDHTYAVASKIHHIAVKINPEDSEKAERAVQLVEEHVRIDKILEKI